MSWQDTFAHVRLWHGHVKEECLHFFVFFKPAVKPGVFDISVVFKWQQNWHKKDILKQQQSHPLQKTRAFWPVRRCFLCGFTQRRDFHSGSKHTTPSSTSVRIYRLSQPKLISQNFQMEEPSLKQWWYLEFQKDTNASLKRLPSSSCAMMLRRIHIHVCVALLDSLEHNQTSEHLIF